jgi:hypothetical protein
VGQLWVHFLVDIGRFFVAEGRACWGQVKNVAFPKSFSKAEDSNKEHRVWKIVCGKKVYCLGKIATSTSNFAHVHFLLVTPPSLKRVFTCSFGFIIQLYVK